MTVACVILAVIAALCTMSSLHYRRQIMHITEQIAFFNGHETNMLLTCDRNGGCLAKLTCELNTMLEQTTALRKRASDDEARVKETIINLSHDIRTPLTSIDGYFQLMSGSSDCKEQQKYARIVRGRIAALKNMLDELFMYARMANGDSEMNLAPCTLNSLLLNSLFGFYNDIKQRGIEPVISVPEQDIVIEGNEPALDRIFQNTIKNSLEHGREYLSVSLLRDGDAAKICFANDIDTQSDIDITKVFDRFYKADAARGRNSTGLGLSIVKELVERLNGSISCAVDESVFCITIEFCIAGAHRGNER